LVAESHYEPVMPVHEENSLRAADAKNKRSVLRQSWGKTELAVNSVKTLKHDVRRFVQSDPSVLVAASASMSAL